MIFVTLLGFTDIEYPTGKYISQKTFFTSTKDEKCLMCDRLKESSINGNIQPIFCNVALEKAIGYNIPEKSIVTQYIKTS